MTESFASPRLQGWPAKWGERRPRRNTGMLWLGVVLFAAAAAMIGFSGGAAGPLWSGAFVSLFGLTALAVAARRPFAEGRARLVDAATLARGQIRSPDARVHFVPERRPGIVTLTVCVVWAIVLTAATIVAVGIGLTGRPEAFLGVAVLAATAALFVYTAVRAAMTQYRSDSFGRRPMGLGIGHDGVLLMRVAETLYVPWSAIRRVEPDTTEPRRGIDELPLIRLRVDPSRVTASDGMRVPATVTVAPAMLKTHPQVVWSALREFHDSPEARAALGTSTGQRMLDEWCASAPAD
ncbi:hypothetical protein [Microbacterium sp. Leaf159]|uniref:hypothetical protein n=1 Tax=Microbacterium sp. Leaf159 TaxID=1736279 RepID=UPI0012F78ABC|nr:hypothetical protein [Microbacterium sp. Leaf159]